MRMTEDQYQNMRLNRTGCVVVKDCDVSDAMVAELKKDDHKRKIVAISNDHAKTILDCEIATVPPSVNHYWKASGKKRFLSSQAKAFHRIVRQLVPAHKTIERLKLEVTFHFPDRRCRDIDNYLKATIDSLVKCGLCVDDEQFDELIVKRGYIIKGGLIKLKVCTM